MKDLQLDLVGNILPDLMEIQKKSNEGRKQGSFNVINTT